MLGIFTKKPSVEPAAKTDIHNDFIPDGAAAPDAAQPSPVQPISVLRAEKDTVTVTVARGRTIGCGRDVKKPGETLEVSPAEYDRLKASGFVL